MTLEIYVPIDKYFIVDISECMRNLKFNLKKKNNLFQYN